MINLINTNKIYGLGWSVAESAPLSKEDVEAISSAVVVDSQYGKSMMFILKAGGSIYQPISNRKEGECTAGQTVPLKDIKLLRLTKSGEADIYRVDC